MPRIADLIARVQDSLGDTTRWPVSRLYSLIDEAQFTLATEASLVRKKQTVQVIQASSVQAYPGNMYKLTRVTDSTGKLIPIKSTEEMDAIDPYWEIAVGTEIEYIVYDNSSTKKYRVYPILIPDTTTTTNVSYSDSFLSSFGTLVGRMLPTENYSVSTAVTPSSIDVVMYYLATPVQLNSYSTELTIPEEYDNALYYFILLFCYLDYADTHNVAMAKEMFTLYEAELEDAKKESSNNFTKAVVRLTSMLWAD